MNSNFTVTLQDDVYFYDGDNGTQKRSAEHEFICKDVGVLLSLINQFATTSAGALTIIINPEGGRDDG